MGSHPKFKMIIKPEFYIAIALLIFLLPLEWAAAWLISAAVHEIGHFVLLRLCGTEIYSVSVGIFGAAIRTAPLEIKEELVCALAGPFAGGLLVVFYRFWPCVAVCAAAQTVFNLLPIYHSDGGRALKCILHLILGENAATAVFEIVLALLFFVFLVVGLLCLLVFDAGPIPLCAVVWLLSRCRE